MLPMDVDSTPDMDPSDDPTNPLTDEDDIDYAEIPVGQEMDLAIDKAVSSPGPYTAGNDVTFTLTVTNEGSVDAEIVDLVDYFPASDLILNDINWIETSV